MGAMFIWLITGIQAIFLPALEYIGKRAAIYSTIVVAFVTLTSLFAQSFQTFLAQASGTYQDGYGIFQYAGLILPSNFPLVVAIIINAKIIRFGYKYMIQMYSLSKS